jgi:hypothetical protein
MTKVTVDTDAAEEVLYSEWETVQAAREEGTASYLGPEYQDRISTVLEGSQKTFRYLLVTAAVAKATDNSVHYRALKKNDCSLDGSYAPRTTAKTVVMPWNIECGNRLEASAYPLAGNPTQSYSQFRPESNVQNPALRMELYELLDEFQTKTESGELDETEILRAVLNGVADLDPRRPDFDPVSLDAPYYTVVDELERFLADSDGGNPLMAVSGALLEVCWQDGGGDHQADLGHANAADDPRDAVGDVWVEATDDETVLLGAEVKHTTVTETEMLLASKKAKEHNLDRYLVIAESFDGFEEIREAAADEPLDLILVTIDELLQWMQPLDDSLREEILDKIGEHLRTMGANRETLTTWESTLSSVQRDQD